MLGNKYNIAVGINGAQPQANALIPQAQASNSPTAVSEATKAPMLSNGMLLVYSKKVVGQALNEKLNNVGFYTGDQEMQRRIANVQEAFSIGSSIAGGYVQGGVVLGTLNAGFQLMTMQFQQDKFAYQQHLDNTVANIKSQNSVLGNNNGRSSGND